MRIDLDDYGTDWPIITVRVSTPDWELMILAFATIDGRSLTLERLDIHGMRANAFGIANLQRLARFAMEQADVDEIIVKGSARTSGANPGRVPDTLRFIRHSRA